jgi:hypothetical protein
VPPPPPSELSVALIVICLFVASPEIDIFVPATNSTVSLAPKVTLPVLTVWLSTVKSTLVVSNW